MMFNFEGMDTDIVVGNALLELCHFFLMSFLAFFQVCLCFVARGLVLVQFTLRLQQAGVNWLGLGLLLVEFLDLALELLEVRILCVTLSP